jgi:hypothetical protein
VTACIPAPSRDLADIADTGCACAHVDRDALRTQVEAVLRAHDLPAALADTHPHLFSALPIFVAPAHLAAVADVTAVLERIVGRPVYRDAVLAWAPDAAHFDPGSPGGLLGLDFHLTADGPRLIEVNTNPGGVLINALVAEAQDCCLPEQHAHHGTRPVRQAVLDVLRAEWRAQRGDAPLRRMAIVDEAPARQYLYPEFLMFHQLLREHGHDAVICDPAALHHDAGALHVHGTPIDFVYNRLTDFALATPPSAALRSAYLAGDVAVSPHPRAHALHADKRALTLLGDPAFLRDAGLDEADIATLSAAVPETRIVTPDARDALWADRRHWFFKPAAGFGSRASYRGDKLTRRVWDEIAQGTYVAQRIVPPSERALPGDGGRLKVDLRCYAYRGRVLLFAARTYQGQTTNFRTPGGGFAPVLAS